MPKDQVLILDGSKRVLEVKKRYKTELKDYCLSTCGLIKRYTTKTIKKKADGSAKVETFYYKYEYRDQHGKPFEIPDDYHSLPKKEKSEFLKRKKLTLHQRYVGTKDPLVDIPDPPKNPLEGLKFTKKGDNILLDKKSYEKFNHLFKGLEVYQ